jgi:hypothetical protein
MEAGLIALIVLGVFLFIVAAAGVRIVPQARAGIVERLGRYQRTLDAGLALIVPFIDRVKPLIDLREQVVTFPPQPVITEDNLVVGIDTVIYFTVTDPKAATYEVANPLQAIEQLTVTTLRNVIGGLTLEETLTSRDNINSQLRVVLDDATGKWGIRVNRVELKGIDPPPSIQDSMEKQMRAERDKRAAILGELNGVVAARTGHLSDLIAALALCQTFVGADGGAARLAALLGRGTRGARRKVATPRGALLRTATGTLRSAPVCQERPGRLASPTEAQPPRCVRLRPAAPAGSRAPCGKGWAARACGRDARAPPDARRSAARARRRCSKAAAPCALAEDNAGANAKTPRSRANRGARGAAPPRQAERTRRWRR